MIFAAAKKSRFFVFWTKALIFFMVLQGIPLQQIGQAYEVRFDIQRYRPIIDFFSPSEAEAAAPVADSGADQFLNKNLPVERNAVLLIGSDSFDPDGDTLTYYWFGPFPSVGGESPSVTIPEGTYTVSLRVGDGNSISDPDTSVITIDPCFEVSARVKSGKVQLTWTNQQGAERYDIYRADTSDPYTFVKIADTDSTYCTYLDTSVENEVTYLYTVGALSEGTWCYSNVVASHPTSLRTRTPVNYEPVIYSRPIAHGYVNIVYNYDVNAADPNGGSLIYSLTSSPSGMSIDSSTGLITWMPEDCGSYDMTVEVTDGEASDTQVFTVDVTDIDSDGDGIPDCMELDMDLEPASMDVTGVVVDPQTLQMSGTVEVEIGNNGTDAIPTAYELVLFEDTDMNQVFDLNTDQALGAVTITDGPSGGTAFTVSVDIAGNALFAGNLIYAFVDASNQVDETDEDNNIVHSMASCEYIPPVGTFDPVLEWQWTGSPVIPSSNQVMCAPVVANLNDDNGDGGVDRNDIPDIIFNTFAGSQYNYNGTLRAISGDGSCELFSVTGYQTLPGCNPAVGDIDNDGLVEIVAVEEYTDSSRTTARILAFENDGTFKWSSDYLTLSFFSNTASPGIADIDNDGMPEVVVGSIVLNSDGTTKWTGDGGNERLNSVIADINLDGKSEIIAGNTAYDSNGNILWRNEALSDGFLAVANFDDDAFPEIVLVSGGYVYLLEHTGEVVWGPVDLPPAGTSRDHGGPPTIADYDNDDEPEIGIAGGYRYVVFESDGTVKWSSPTRDYSSNRTGSSVFDFEGDGIAEVAYADEHYLRIYRGTDGQVLFQTYIGSGTLLELPVIVDVDNDNNAEVVVASNSYAFGGKTGIQVFGDANDTWVNTRKIWNQHAYSITNVNEDGTIPQYPANNWDIFNNFRQNQMLNPFGCIDLTASYLRVNSSNCPDSVEILARIGNGGALHTPPGLKAAIYDGDPDSGGILRGTAYIADRLGPGEYAEVAFTLENDISGMHTIYVVADDDGAGTGMVSEIDENNNKAWATFNLCMNPPVFTSSPLTEATKGEAYIYDADATDPDAGDVLTFSLTVFPSNMTVGSTDGLIEWTPDGSQIGENPVTVRVEDAGGLFATQSFVISVVPVMVLVPDVAGQAQADAEAAILVAGLTVGAVSSANSAVVPAGHVISQNPAAGTSTAEGTAVNLVISVGQEMVIVPDVAGQAQAYAEAAIVAAGLTVGAVSSANSAAVPVGCVISQTPAAGAAVAEGTAVNLVISLGTVVATDYTRPEVMVTVFPTAADAGELVTISVNASDDVEVVSLELLVNGEPISMDGSGTATYSSFVPGVFSAVAKAFDDAGNEGFDSEEFRFLIPGDSVPPTVAIVQPANETKISLPTDIVGTATDDETLTRFTLEYSAKGRNEFVVFASGFAPVTNDVIGVLDPTIMRNGLYDIRLTAEDASGNTASIMRTYQLEGDMKVGNFTISFNDLTIPMAGVPITITRTYDSRVKSGGDFGIGWSLDLKAIEVQENRIPGEGWEIYCTNSIFGVCVDYGVRSTQTHTVLVGFPDGRDHEFEVRAQTSYAYAGGLAQGHLAFDPQPGTFSSLQAVDHLTYDYLLSGELLDLGFNPVDPDRYRLTDVDGTVFLISQANGLEQITDPNGNTVAFTSSGIIHSAGKSVSFTRDTQGRITAIIDPMGETIEFEYDFYGDLVSVTDQEGNVTGFRYNSAHGLLDIIDPRGLTPARNEYDNQGKLVAITDADGNRVEFTHNIDTRQEVVTDRMGNATVYEYDDEGNVVTQTDALGNTISYTYDANGNKLTETDALGNTTAYTYDAQENLLTKTDPLGNTTSYTYNARNQVLTVTDPLSNVTANNYDARGNLLAAVDPLGNTTTNTYDASGNLLTTTDPEGNVTSYSYDSFGNMLSHTDALGNISTFTYDANGNRLTQTVVRTTASGPETLTTTNVYDRRNRVIETVDPLSNSTTTEYNLIGKESAVTDKNGNRTTQEYDAAGNLVATTYPDGTTETSTYDANGNRISSTDRAGRTTIYTLDALKRVTRTTFPDGSATTATYDAAGRESATTDERGNTTTYGYDAVGRRISVTDALGNVNTYTYDANGNQLAFTDANGHTTSYEYNANNRKIETIFHDGTFTTTGFDALGRKISETDQAGISTSFDYDVLGRLVSVTDAFGQVTSYEYDELGNRISQTDANGNTTSWEYDGLGRVTKRTLPLGMSETFTYDAVGNVLGKTDFNGNVTVFAYDENNRLILKTYHDASTVAFEYTPAGQRLTVNDYRGLTSYSYDTRDRLSQVTEPDGATIAYTYDAASNRTSVTISSGTTTYSYDALSRLKTVTDPNGGITSYTYDAAGNRSGMSYPNGTETSYAYDSLDRLVYIENVLSNLTVISSYSYTLGPAGNRVRVVENTGRTVDYTYDDLYRLVREDIADAVLGDETVSYTYDPVGNRLTKEDSVSTTNYNYDENDRLLTEGFNTYIYDANGNTISKSDGMDTTVYGYDYENRLIEAQTPTSLVDYTYDADGVRVSSNADGVETNYLVDKNRDYAQVVEETDGIGDLVASYVHGEDLISQSRNGVLSFYHYDGQMSTRKLTDIMETETDSYAFDAFGILLHRNGTTVNDYLYTGQQYDPNCGFYYLRTRYYDPMCGRFLNVDTYSGNIYDPKTLHKYSYTENNPVNFSDPSGKFSLASFTITVSIIGALSAASIYSYLNPPGSEKFTWKGLVVWTISGAAAGATLAVAGWYSWLYWGPAITTSVGGTTFQVGRQLVNRWPNLNVLSGHFAKHGTQISNILRTGSYPLSRYASDAAFVVDNYIYKTYNASRGAWYYIRFLGNSQSGKAYFAFVVEKGGKIVSFRPIWVKEAAKFFPELFK